MECECLSINRIAADDDPDSIMDAFYHSQTLGLQIRMKCEEQGIMVLTDMDIVSAQLHGHGTKTPAVSWA